METLGLELLQAGLFIVSDEHRLSIALVLWRSHVRRKSCSPMKNDSELSRSTCCESIQH